MAPTRAHPDQAPAPIAFNSLDLVTINAWAEAGVIDERRVQEFIRDREAAIARVLRAGRAG